ncbi:hypothetical protein TRFO_41440 [Tritrichomonas foetus]|uniref:Uncharacterized protein n=1 Tax=Tritrichomonas foetus TaxID=1144522 RepID=A0A1J4L4U6_9EUKA|nr:hypothetical protein TRFO_41440 [Tritrichomonas foetus]|eukprot:OHT16958.1 hypothetical protein TRFO_41440 [Tritrichomonas foetus]
MTQWNEKFDDFLETTETEYSSLISKHEQELNEFDQNAPEELTPQYRKRSVALLELRNKELALAKDKQFAAAQTLKNKNDQIENKEALRQFEKMQNDFLKKRERLISKQEEQIRVFMSHADSVRSNLLQSRANMLEGYLKRMNKLNNEIENMVENKKLKYDDIDTIILPIDRVMKIEETETDSAPIPTLRQETFTSIRQQIRRKQQLREEKAKKALTQKQTEQPVPPAPFVTTSELEQFKEYREIKEEETEETKTVEEETETVEEETEKEPVEEEEKEEEKVEEEEEQNEEDKIEELPQEENEMELYTRKDVADITFFTSTIATFANDTRDNINEKFAEREREETNDEANTKANDETNDGINTEANDETKNEKIDEMNKKVNKTNEENHNISSNSEKLEDDKKADHETDNEKNAEN